jgi:hypothetical protein
MVLDFFFVIHILQMLFKLGHPKKLDQKSHPNPSMVSNFVMVS